MTSNNKLPADWTVGKYVDREGQEALLGIYYTIGGQPAERPLMMPMSDADSPAKVRGALSNAGADLEYLGDSEKQQEQELRRRLDPQHLVKGIYARKLGWVDDRFIMLVDLHTGARDLIVEPKVLKRAGKHFARSGKLKDWKATVAANALKSSYCGFAILQALAAPLFSPVFGKGEEGFLVNLAGDSSLGKTTCLRVGKSISGPGDRLSTWNQSDRALAEDAATFSDLFMPIDDLDKKRTDKSFVKNFPQLLHSLTSGESSLYAAMVKDKLPDLRWTFCGMTGSGVTIEIMKGRLGVENHERVRCFEFQVPSADEGGIWDRRDEDDVPSRLSDEMKAACCSCYGVVLPRWVKTVQDEATVERARQLAEEWVLTRGLPASDALGNRIAKKFGLCYAAGIVGIEAKILPWDEAFVSDVVGKLHADARKALYPYEFDVANGMRRLKKAAITCVKNPMPRGKTPSFADIKAARMFARAEQEHLVFITKVYFDRLFGSVEAAHLGGAKLRAAGAMISGSGGLSTSQIRVKIGDKEPSKKRYLQIDVRKLKRA